MVVFRVAPALLKGEYIAAQSLSGAMFWELSNDDGTLLDALRTGLGSPAPPSDKSQAAP
jgi:hypothetical protein